MNEIQFSRNRYEESREEEEEYEVDQILKHRTGKSGRKFLVRWKGYGSKHDLWVNEKGLNCPKILNAYLKINKL